MFHCLTFDEGGIVMSIYADACMGITHFQLQEQAGSSWSLAARYEHNHRYRFHACFHNYSLNTIPGGIYIVRILVKYALNGATFDESRQNWGNNFLMPRLYDGHQDFNDLIGPGQSRWFDFGYFTWVGPTATLAQHPVDFVSSHSEIRYMPEAPHANLVPTQV
jgi:hypothetical protein